LIRASRRDVSDSHAVSYARHAPLLAEYRIEMSKSVLAIAMGSGGELVTCEIVILVIAIMEKSNYGKAAAETRSLHILGQVSRVLGI
jgi:hypothetical protein